MKKSLFIIHIILSFSTKAPFADEKENSSLNRLDYKNIEERLRNVDVKLTKLLRRIDSYSPKEKSMINSTKEREKKNTPTFNLPQSEFGLSEERKKRNFSNSSNSENTESFGETFYDTTPSFSELDSKQEVLTKNLDKIKKKDGWNLFILRELALKHSPDVLLKKAELRMENKDIPIIKFGNMPTLKAKISFDDYEKISKFETYSEPEPYNTFSYGVEGRWVLYNGHKVRKQVDIAENEISRAQWSVHIEEQRVLKNLTNLYFQALSAQTQVRYLPKIEAISKEKLSVYTQKLKSGIVDRMLLNDSIRELEGVRAQVLNSFHSLEMAKSELGFLLNVDNSFWNKYEKFLTPEDFDLKNEFQPTSSLAASLGQSGVDIAKSKYEEIKTGNSPVVELIGSAGHRSRNKLTFNNKGQELTLGLSVTIPVTDYFLTRKKLDHAREEIKKSELEKLRLMSRQRNEFSSEKLRLKQTERSLSFQMEMLALQKKRLSGIISGSTKGIYDKSNILMEEEKLQKREMYVELTRINYIKQKYQLDLIN